jgi:hypothetical protein
MLSLKKIYLPLGEKQELEKAMRNAALKRLTSLDFKSSVTDIGTDKPFLGFESKEDVQFTRLRTSFEKYLPKVIISIPKNETDNEYKFRFSILSSVVVILWSLFFLLIVTTVLVQKGNYENILIGCIHIGLFILLTLLELRIVGTRIEKAIKLNLQSSIR